jgi:SAM-dependent methyltransferase
LIRLARTEPLRHPETPSHIDPEVRVPALASALPDLSARLRQGEIMDDPSLERSRHLRALDALERINRVSGTAARIWSEVRELARKGVRPVRVLDVACGGGDVLLDVSRRARRVGIEVELHGCDRSPVALERARLRMGSSDCLLHERDVLAGRLPVAAHVVASSLFLHHLSSTSAIELLRVMRHDTEQVLLVQDLRRTRAGFLLAWLGLHALTRSEVARADGLTSVRAAFSLAEARELATSAGLSGAQVRPCWPQRFVLRWARP